MLSEADIFDAVSLQMSIIKVFLHLFAVSLVCGVDADGRIGVLEVMGIVVDTFFSPENFKTLLIIFFLWVSRDY